MLTPPSRRPGRLYACRSTSLSKVEAPGTPPFQSSEARGPDEPKPRVQSHSHQVALPPSSPPTAMELWPLVVVLWVPWRGSGIHTLAPTRGCSLGESETIPPNSGGLGSLRWDAWGIARLGACDMCTQLWKAASPYQTTRCCHVMRLTRVKCLTGSLLGFALAWRAKPIVVMFGRAVWLRRGR